MNEKEIEEMNAFAQTLKDEQLSTEPISGEFWDDEILRAAKTGDTYRASVACRSGANINALNAQRDTPLHMAAAYGHPRMIAWLLSHGADLNARNNDGDTPLDYACYYGHDQAARALNQHGETYIHTDSGCWAYVRSSAAGIYMVRMGDLYYIVDYRRPGQFRSILPADKPVGGECFIGSTPTCATGRRRKAAMAQWRRHIIA